MSGKGLLRGESGKASMARVMLWITFIYMMAYDWMHWDKDVFGWEWIFTGLLTYVMTGKFGFGMGKIKGMLRDEELPGKEERPKTEEA